MTKILAESLQEFRSQNVNESKENTPKTSEQLNEGITAVSLKKFLKK